MRGKRYKTKKVNRTMVSEPSQQYGNVATLDEIKNILREVALSSKETDRRFQETDRKFQESERMLTEKFQETDRKMQETDREIKESSRRLDTIAKMVGGISKNMGDAAEDFFFNGLSATSKIGDIRYDFVERNKMRKFKGIESEFDSLLVNSNTVVVVEINYKVHPDEIDKLLNKKIPAFKKLYPEYKGYTIYGAIAGFALTPDTISLAKKHGLFVLTQSGENVKMLNERGFKPSAF